ncbi:hypothetical protein [Lentzea sp. CC55]|uniref:hypothetical protein n=1 Tax=Lentzea sp. CC55 TaxID=2884909 RepID=UPI001F4638E7|nr:hypothetical protein [Lentzea sp. CC55]MCG8923210.1 hypothetical protein [Lentzea sp. CC55]
MNKPHLPDEQGSLIQSFVLVEEAAHRVGRALYAFGDHALSDAVIAEVQEELAAVEHAELGDLDDEEDGNRVDEEFFEPLREQAEDERDRLL